MRKLPLIVALCSIVTVSTVQADGKKLSGDGIKALLSGASVSGTTSKGAPYRVMYNADGTVSLATEYFSDTGTWRIKGDTYCAKWKTIRRGNEACFSMVSHGDVDYHFINVDGKGRTQDGKVYK